MKKQTEIDIKLNLMQLAVQSGELDHLHPDQTIHGRSMRKIYRIAEDILKECPATSADVLIQSIIPMVHTILETGQVVKLDQALRKTFPDYYFDQGPNNPSISQ
jgi:hypothetical protein